MLCFVDRLLTQQIAGSWNPSRGVFCLEMFSVLTKCGNQVHGCVAGIKWSGFVMEGFLYPRNNEAMVTKILSWGNYCFPERREEIEAGKSDYCKDPANEFIRFGSLRLIRAVWALRSDLQMSKIYIII